MRTMSAVLLSSAFGLWMMPAFAQTVTIPNTFTAGTPAKAAEVNADFTAVKTAVDSHDARITAVESAAGSRNSLDGAGGTPKNAVFVDATGNVGIGTTTPATGLTVVGRTLLGNAAPTNPLCATLTVNDAISGLSGCVPGLMIGGSYTTAMWLGTNSSNSVDFVWLGGAGGYARVQSTGVLSLNGTGGNVGVGTTTPSLKFYVNGTAGGTSTWTTSSDLRLKTDVVDLKDALSKVRRLRGVSFRWADRVVAERAPAPERGRQVGFIAQEVREVVPEVVLEDQAGMLSIAYASLVPVLVEAIKQQQETIDEMTHRVRQLEMKALETVSLKEEVDALRRSVGALVAPGPRTQEANADSESSERHRLPACASFGKVAGAQPANRM